MAGTYAKTAQISDAVQGAWIEVGTITLDAASIAAAAQGLETTTVTGVKVGDQVFATAREVPAMSALVGAKVTATDTVTFYINNMYDATTARDLASLVYDVMIVHLT